VKRRDGSNSKTSIDIEWSRQYDGGSEITGYQIWWNSAGLGPVNEIKTVIAGDTNNYRAVGLDQGIYYGFAVKAINSVGTSELSVQVTLMSAQVPSPP
jgi:hypothetical protein